MHWQLRCDSFCGVEAGYYDQEVRLLFNHIKALKTIRTKTHQNDSVFPIRDILMRFISLNWRFWAPIRRIFFIVFEKDYDGNTIYDIPIFRPSKFLSTGYKRKNVQFSDSAKSKAMIWNLSQQKVWKC